MVARHLVTTAIEDTWPSKNLPILFLGEWCCLYSRLPLLEQYDFEVVPYHWDDREKLYSDYQYLLQVYESTLLRLSHQLNLIHNTNHSVRYWRILVGPWLGFFLHVIFDRWFMIDYAYKNYCISGIHTIHHNNGDLVPNGQQEFQSLFTSDHWNEHIYSEILNILSIPVTKSNVRSTQPNLDNRPVQVSSHTNLVTKIRNTLSSEFVKIISRDNEYFFLEPGLSRFNKFLLQLKLGQIPKLWRPLNVPQVSYCPDSRDWQLGLCNLRIDNTYSGFLDVINSLIPKHIPKLYLEGYSCLQRLIADSPWPSNPKLVFTISARVYQSDDYFKAWVAEKVDKKVPLVIGQHGGNFGTARWNFAEEHQIDISTNFLTWGWESFGRDNVQPFGVLTNYSHNVLPKKDGFALLVEMSLPRYSYHLYSAPVASGQWQSYFLDQCRFIRALPPVIVDQVLVRLYRKGDYGHDQINRWQNRFPRINLDSGKDKISVLMRSSRICVSTYNATTLLESQSINFPTIMFWNEQHWELREEAEYYFGLLKSVGIFHSSPESAAKQLASVWGDVSGWWFSKDVQSARSEFCGLYARIPNRRVNMMVNQLQNICKI